MDSLTLAFALALSSLPAVTGTNRLTPEYETREIHDWTLNIRRELLVDEPDRTERAVQLLEKQLEEIARVVPRSAVEELRKVRLYFSPEYEGARPTAEYHPNAAWLRIKGRDPAMARSIEFTNIRIFEEETNRMPNFALHELAHAYHDRVLPRGFDNAEIKQAFAHAKKSGAYDKVERHFGNGEPNTVEKAYALTNSSEYFAETSEAFFARNDFFPFTRDELKSHDPVMFELLAKVWAVAPES